MKTSLAALSITMAYYYGWYITCGLNPALVADAFVIAPSRNNAHSTSKFIVVRHQAASDHLEESSSDDPSPRTPLPPLSPVDLVAQLPLLRARLLEVEAVSTSSEEEQDNQDQQKQTLLEQIDQGETAAELGVRRSQVEFYQAFSTHDFEQMSKLWTSSEDDCECIHPGMSSLKGRTAILESWQGILTRGSAAGDGEESSSVSSFQIEPIDTQLDICGTTAVVRCIEQIGVGSSKSRLEAINIYRREQGKWKMTFHMAAPIVMMAG
jgi:ketosteroid isomerase-like protein